MKPGLKAPTFADSQCGGPLWSEYIETDATVAIDIRMIDSRREGHLQQKVSSQLSRTATKEAAWASQTSTQLKSLTLTEH